MFRAVDALADVVEFAVDLISFLGGKFAAVGTPVVFDLFPQFRFPFFQPRGFGRRELTVLNALGDSVLLIFFATPDLGLGLNGLGLQLGGAEQADEGEEADGIFIGEGVHGSHGDDYSGA